MNSEILYDVNGSIPFSYVVELLVIRFLFCYDQ